jgi:hypothetical protein
VIKDRVALVARLCQHRSPGVDVNTADAKSLARSRASGCEGSDRELP